MEPPERATTPIAVHLYTIQSFMLGTVRTAHHRLSDILNDGNLSVELENVIAVDYDSPAMRFSGSRSLVFKSAIYFACDRPSPSYAPERGPLASEREPHRVVLCCGPFFIDGSVHLPPGGDLRARFFSASLPFVPVTNARIASSRFTQFTEQTVLVNRERIDYIILPSDFGHDVGQPSSETNVIE